MISTDTVIALLISWMNNILFFFSFLLKCMCCVFAGGFPMDFSVLATIKPDEGTRGKIFSIYDDKNAMEILALKVGKYSELIYQDSFGRPGEPIPIGVDLSDGE